MKRFRILLLTSWAALCLHSVSAAPGDLDPTFHALGYVMTPVGTSTDLANGVAVQSDGKMVVVGQTYNGSNSDFCVVRYNVDGSLDTTFNGTGKQSLSFGSGDDIARAVAIQSDGKIVVIGHTNDGSRWRIADARFTTAGQLDSSFGNGGKSVISLPGSVHDYGFGVAIQSDGSIVIVGTDQGSSYDMAVVRLTSSANLDTSFNGTGMANIAVGAGTDEASCVAIQSDGKIVVGGYSRNATDNDFAAVRLMPNGSLDTSFNGTGKLITPIGPGNERANSVTIQTDGKIVLAGGSFDNSGISNIALVRYTSTGVLDTNFGTAGKSVARVGVEDPFCQSRCLRTERSSWPVTPSWLAVVITNFCWPASPLWDCWIRPSKTRAI